MYNIILHHNIKIIHPLFLKIISISIKIQKNLQSRHLKIIKILLNNQYYMNVMEKNLKNVIHLYQKCRKHNKNMFVSKHKSNIIVDIK